MVDVILPELPTNYLSDLGKVIEQSNLQASVHLILSDCVGALVSQNPSLEQFGRLAQEQAGLQQEVLAEVYNKFFGLLATLYKAAITAEEFKSLLMALFLPEDMHEECTKSYVELLEVLKLKKNGIEGLATLSKKLPQGSNPQLGDDYLTIRFAELVNVEWKALQEICTMHMSAVYESKFLLRLYILTNDCDTAVSTSKPLSDSLHRLRIKTIEMNCTQAELQHFLYQANEALNEVGRLGGT